MAVAKLNQYLTGDSDFIPPELISSLHKNKEGYYLIPDRDYIAKLKDTTLTIKINKDTYKIGNGTITKNDTSTNQIMIPAPSNPNPYGVMLTDILEDEGSNIEVSNDEGKYRVVKQDGRYAIYKVGINEPIESYPSIESVQALLFSLQK